MRQLYFCKCHYNTHTHTHTHTHIYIYIYIYIYIGRSTMRFVFFEFIYLFILFLTDNSRLYHQDYNSTILINHHHHHHHIVPLARISLTLSRHFSLSFIASGRSSGPHPISSHSCWMYVRADRPAFSWLYVGFHRSTSLMSSSLLLQQCPARLVRLTWIVFVMGSRWPYSWCLVGCCRQDLFNIARNILV